MARLHSSERRCSSNQTSREEPRWHKPALNVYCFESSVPVVKFD